MNYLCFRCGTEYKYKKSFYNHLSKKCKPKILYIDTEYIKENYDTCYDNCIQIYNESKKKKILKYVCYKCFKSYNSRNYYYKHANKYCTDLDNQIEPNNTHTQNMNLQNNMQQTINNINQPTTNNINQPSNSHNTITNSNNTNISNINNITINNYNEEPILTKNMKNKHFKIIKYRPAESIQEIFKNIHIDTPEYRNIYINSLKEAYGLGYINGEWVPVIVDDLLNVAIENSANVIYDAIKDNEDKLDKKRIFRAEETIAKLTEDNKKPLKRWRQIIKYITYHNRDLIKENYENSIGKKVLCNLKPKIKQS